MPIISSMGALSTRGYGQFRIYGPLVPSVPGTKGLFYLSTSTTGTNKYTFADKTMVIGVALKATVLQGAAAGNANLVIGMGQSNSAMQKYTWTGEVTSIGPALTPAVSLGAATSNAALAFFHRGRNGNTTALYTYAADTIAEGSVSVTSGRWMSAAGNSTRGIFKFGGVATTNRYTYSDASWAASTSMTDASLGGAACGVAAYAIFALGEMMTKSNKYEYATDTTTVATAFTVGMGYGGAVGIDTSGLYASGGSNSSVAQDTTSEYGWAAGTTSAGTALTTNSSYTSGSGNGTTGVNI